MVLRSVSVDKDVAELPMASGSDSWPMCGSSFGNGAVVVRGDGVMEVVFRLRQAAPTCRRGWRRGKRSIATAGANR